MSSFKRNLNPTNRKQTPSSYPAGFHPSHYNGVPTASTGIASLDDLLGGGLPIASSFLIDEDQDGGYAKLMLRYSIAQGIVSNQHLIIVGSSLDEGGDPEKIVDRLMSLDDSDEPIEPTSSSNQHQSTASCSTPQSDQSKQTPPSESESIYQQSRCHSFNLSKTMKISPDLRSKIDCLDVKNLENLPTSLLARIKQIIENKQKVSSSNPSFRIVIQSIGSIGWPPMEDHMIFRFLKDLETVLRAPDAPMIAIISFPSAYRSSDLAKILPWATSGSLSLQSFAGDEKSQAAFPNHQGAVHFIRLPSPSSLSPPATKLSVIRALGGASEAGIGSNLGFKLGRRKGFRIEMMGLGLDLENDNPTEEAPATPRRDEPSEVPTDDIDQLKIANPSQVKRKSAKPKPKVRFGDPSHDSSHDILKNTDW
ncbi:hypothetical protein PtA15_3A606 [Puccinia triticina]|uniref:Elongator complex protein 4 n=1 Tax=Puccinia triticina TaxID=208348 RepID=A0ABY7CH13_9BASI|nr:uncharacterized protein PtA15_3A606 [Puccinia triticina]WAQ83237.1 hypothetical protein PtA15_3A606 [Puccinia triticina]WAR54086.1 hypothetical protein PtB15_3B596 [Puccinia triticina]